MKERRRIRVTFRLVWRILVWTFIIYMLGKSLFKQIFDYRPFIFERYKLSREISSALNKQFPCGSNVDEASNALVNSGAKCIETEHHCSGCITTDREIRCEYSSDFLLIYPPFPGYSVILIADRDRKILDVNGYKKLDFIFGS